MTEVISVKFKDSGKAYYFAPAGVFAKEGDRVIVEMQSGKEMGTVSERNHSVEDENIVKPLRKVLRIANEKDFKKLEENKAKEAEAFDICEEMIGEHKLDMKLVSVEYSFDGSRIVFFFTSDGRVDFRELVKDLAARFHTRIELRQIGVRDEAKMLGGIGICGQPFCCSRFLDEFQPVSIKMAKEQNLSPNPIKISGSCGRLMCCLKYEQQGYRDFSKITPKVGSVVKTPDGTGTVVEANVITGTLKVSFAPKGSNAMAAPKTFHRDDVTVISAAKQKPEQFDKQLKELED